MQYSAFVHHPLQCIHVFCQPRIPSAHFHLPSLECFFCIRPVTLSFILLAGIHSANALFLLWPTLHSFIYVKYSAFIHIAYTVYWYSCILPAPHSFKHRTYCRSQTELIHHAVRVQYSTVVHLTNIELINPHKLYTCTIQPISRPSVQQHGEH